MQDNKNLQAFDSDILQCKADILKALGASGDQPGCLPPVEPETEMPAKQDSPDDTFIQPDFPDAEDKGQIVTTPDSPLPADSDSGEIVHIPSFESLPKRPLHLMINSDALLGINPQEQHPDKDTVSDAAEFIIPDDDPLDVSNIDSEEVHAENGILKTSLEQLQKHLTEERKEKEKALDQLRAVSEAIEPLRSTNEQLERRLSELTAQNQAAIRESNQIHQGLIRSLEEEKAAQAAAGANVRKLQSELQKVQKAREFLTESFSAVSEQNQLLQAQIDDLEHQRANLADNSEQVTHLRQRIQELERRTAEAETATANVNAALAEMKHQNQDLLAQRHDFQQKLEAVDEELRQARQSLQIRQEQARQKDQQVFQLQQRIEQLSSLEKELQAVVSHNHALRQDLSETEATLSQHQVKIRELDAQVSRLSAEKESAQQEAEQLRQSGQELKTDEAARQQEMHTLQKTYADYRRKAEEEAAELNQRAESLSNQVVKVQQQVAAYREQTEKLELSLGERTAAHEMVCRELEQYREKEKSVLTQIAALEKKIASQEVFHQNELQTAKCEIDAVEKERQELQLRYQESQRQIERLELELRLRDDIQPAEAEPIEPADRRLETILEPEELSALMQPLDQEPVDTEAVSETQPLDTSPKDAGKPDLSLADLIMSEHRRSVSSRRQRVTASGHVPADRGIQHVVGQYVKSDAPAAPLERDAPESVRSANMWEDDFLTPFQREILGEIIRKDIESLGQKNRSMQYS